MTALGASATTDYATVTAAYWAFTITDGALRTLVLLAFHELGYSPVSLAFLFLLYEAFGVGTNLFGGWIGARHGLDRTLYAGLALQIVALVALSLRGAGWGELATVAFVMGVQALSGVAKDLTKMSAKSSVKLLTATAKATNARSDAADSDSDDADSGELETSATHNRLFRWVAALTGSKNALKGVGFFLGGALLGWVGLEFALRLMAGVLVVVLAAVLVLLDSDLGRASTKPAVGSLFAKSSEINRLSIARFFLFGSRDIWFVVALPVFLADRVGWSFQRIGAFLAIWVIGYGVVQSFTPSIVAAGRRSSTGAASASPGLWGLVLAGATTSLALIATVGSTDDSAIQALIIIGLCVFGVIFAVNSSVHSFLILAFSKSPDDVAMDVGFYYSANAAGRLVGTLLSGVLALIGGLGASLWMAAAFAAIAGVVALGLTSESATS